MAKGTKVAIKVKGTAAGVKKALSKLVVAEDVPERTVPLREADFRAKMKKNA